MRELKPQPNRAYKRRENALIAKHIVNNAGEAGTFTNSNAGGALHKWLKVEVPKIAPMEAVSRPK